MSAIFSQEAEINVPGRTLVNSALKTRLWVSFLGAPCVVSVYAVVFLAFGRWAAAGWMAGIAFLLFGARFVFAWLCDRDRWHARERMAMRDACGQTADQIEKAASRCAGRQEPQ